MKTAYLRRARPAAVLLAVSHQSSVPARRREEGVAGLWTGVGPNIARNAIINAVELASYDTARPLCPGSCEPA